jgi:hypothetical protein
MIYRGGLQGLIAVILHPMNALINSQEQEPDKFREPISKRFSITDSQ